MGRMGKEKEENSILFVIFVRFEFVYISYRYTFASAVSAQSIQLLVFGAIEQTVLMLQIALHFNVYIINIIIIVVGVDCNFYRVLLYGSVVARFMCTVHRIRF